MKITGQVYARQSQGAFDFERSNLFDSNHIDKQTTVASANFMTPQIMVSKSQNFVESRIDSSNNVRVERRPVKSLASTMQQQNLHENPLSLNALDIENSFHRVRFDSMFRAETIEKEGGIGRHSVTQELSAAPKLLLKRKAAWRAIVGISNSDAANASSAPVTPYEIVAEVGTTLQREQETDLDLVRLRFHNQRCVCSQK